MGSSAAHRLNPQVRTAVVAIRDPMQSPGGNGNERLLAKVNRKVDLLAGKRSHGHIAEAGARSAGS
jgi:hypothetical protein